MHRAFADEVRFAATTDGWRIAVHHYRAAGPRRRHVVICCHGLAANSVVFNVGPDASIARHLAARGYDVFAIDLRGHGMSDHPRLFAGPRRFGWSFDDYLLRDIPAAIETALSLTGGDAVHWIGHSMGGLLLYAQLAIGAAKIRSGITVGSSVDMSGASSGFHGLARFTSLVEHIPAVPLGLVFRLSRFLVGRWVSPLEVFNVWPTNVDPMMWRHVCEHGFHAVSSPVLAQLSTALRQGGLTARDGSSYVRGLSQATTPVFAIAGDSDAQVSVESIRRTVQTLGSPRKQVHVFGPDHGHRDHYGHFDLLMGIRARDEVFPHIDRWLDEHDG